MRRAPIAGAALFVLALGGFFGLRGFSPEVTSQARVADDHAGDDSSDELRALRNQVSSLQAAVAKVSSGNPAKAAVVEAPSDTNEHDLGDEKEPDWSPELFAHKLDTELSKQPVDETWSKAKTAEFQKLFEGKVGASLQLLDATCGSSLCRVSLSHADAAQREQVVSDLRFEGPFIGDGFARFAEGEDGRLETHIFVAREGFKLDALGADS